MTLTITRHRTGHPEIQLTPRYFTDERMGRTDLLCTTCGQRIAFGIDPAHLAVDAPFYLDAHAPFCRSGHL
jgi:hypothetical protein